MNSMPEPIIATADDRARDILYGSAGLVTRFEVIDETGRAYVRGFDPPIQVELSYQDEGRTLKVFVKVRGA